MNPRLGLSLALGIVVLMAAPHPAGAQAKAVKRSIANMAMAPLDAVVSPYTAWQTLDTTLERVDSTGGKVFAGSIGYPYYLLLYGVLAGFREAAGIAELPVALALWPVNAFRPVEVGPFFDASEAKALVDQPTPVMDVKFGGQWLSSH